MTFTTHLYFTVTRVHKNKTPDTQPSYLYFTVCDLCHVLVIPTTNLKGFWQHWDKRNIYKSLSTLENGLKYVATSCQTSLISLCEFIKRGTISTWELCPIKLYLLSDCTKT